MDLLARAFRISGPTHGCPPVPLSRVPETWYLWYQTSSQLLATPYVASSLTLVTLAGSDPTVGFHLRTLIIGKPLTIV
jgi:hypothetical protein